MCTAPTERSGAHVIDPDGDVVSVGTDVFTPEGRVSLLIDAGPGFSPLAVHVTPDEIRALADAAEEVLA